MWNLVHEWYYNFELFLDKCVVYRIPVTLLKNTITITILLTAGSNGGRDTFYYCYNC